jgi:hypothetical protein
LYRFLAIAVLLELKDIPQVGPPPMEADQLRMPDQTQKLNHLALADQHPV